MPLLHQDAGRSGCGPSQNRHLLDNFYGYNDTSHISEPAATPAPNLRNGHGLESEWRWPEKPDSPEAAQSPRALVPPACFPPRHPTAFASYSESAQPGALWAEESTSGQEITDLMASLKGLAMPSASAAPRHRRLPPARRASFCGTSPSRTEVARWSGKLVARGSDSSAGYSPKVFLGGLPWDISETALMQTLEPFAPVNVEWPGRVNNDTPRGFAYVTFESERRVRALLAASRRDKNEWYYRIGARKTKEVQVIPWALSESNWVVGGSVRLQPSRTVFVGALHGMLSASALATIMNDLFAGVVYAGIDTDKYKYPIGSGRVTFNNVRSYIRAISAEYVEIRTDKFVKKVQVNPYLEDSMCSVCNLQQGPYFCREPSCFGYFCRSCWQWQHSSDQHKPLTRMSKSRHETNEQDTLYNGMFSHHNEGGGSGDSGTSASTGPGSDVVCSAESEPWR